MEPLTQQYYKKFKDHALQMLLLLVSFFILFEIIVPQFSAISEIKQNIDIKNKSISDYNQTISTIESVDSGDLDNNLTTVKEALPPGKDIVAIYNTIASVGLKSNAQIKTFSIQVGGIYSRKNTKEAAGTGIPFLNIRLGVETNNLKNLLDFSHVLYQSFPLAEVKKIDNNSNSAEYNINFYYKTLDEKQLAQQNLAAPLTAAEQTSLAQLKNWNR